MTASVSSAAWLSRACWPSSTVRGDQLGVLVAGPVAPAAADLAQLEAAAGLVVEAGQLGQRLADDRLGRARAAAARSSLRRGSSATSSSASSAPATSAAGGTGSSASGGSGSVRVGSPRRSVVRWLIGVLAGGRWDVELVGDGQLALARPRPAYGQLAQGGDLLERDGALAEQLQQRQEARDGGHPVRRVAGQGAEGERRRVRRSRSTTSRACSRTLTAGACRWASETTSACLGASAFAASAAKASGVIVEHHLGQQPGEAGLQGDVAREPAGLLVQGARPGGPRPA